MIVVLTDGVYFTTPYGVEDKLILTPTYSLGYELTREPFRWDQRMYSLLLNMPGVEWTDAQKHQIFNSVDESSPSNSACARDIALMCEVTGGLSY